jgi:hypothetical protein
LPGADAVLRKHPTRADAPECCHHQPEGDPSLRGHRIDDSGAAKGCSMRFRQDCHGNTTTKGTKNTKWVEERHKKKPRRPDDHDARSFLRDLRALRGLSLIVVSVVSSWFPLGAIRVGDSFVFFVPFVSFVV